MKTGRKTTQEERIVIAKECLENECNFEETAKKYNVSYQQVYSWTRKIPRNLETPVWEDRRGKKQRIRATHGRGRDEDLRLPNLSTSCI